MQASAPGANRFTRILCLLGLAAVPVLASAEGAVRILDCQARQVCDAEGSCVTSAERVKFRLAPQAVRDDGSGSYEVSYQDKKASMQALSFAGPFYWATEKERNTLLASSEVDFLWQSIQLAPRQKSSLYFLKCTLS